MATQIVDKPARSKYKWTSGELAYVHDQYGVVSGKTIARNLERSVCGVAWAARKLRLRRRDNLYTATELARVLGIGESKTVIGWVRRGWLKCRKGPLKAGPYRSWVFCENAVAKFLRQRPWLVNPRTMPEHYLRSVVRRKWERDPWYTCQQAAPLLRVKVATVWEYCSRGCLTAEKIYQRGGRPGGPWVIRLSAIRAFLANDPRLQSKQKISEARRKRLLEAGQSSMLAIIWIVKCPRCGQQVRVTAPPRLRGAQAREKFMEQYVDGNCTHGGACLIETYPIVESRKGGE